MPRGLCVVSSLEWQRDWQSLGFLLSACHGYIKSPHCSCDSLMGFVQVSVREVLKRQKHLSNLILTNSCEPSVEQQQKKSL